MNYTINQQRSVDLFRRALVVGLGAQLIIPVAFGQDTATETPTEMTKTVVTGSRLTGAEVEGSLSITKVDMASPINTGFANVVDSIRFKLPQVSGTGNLNEGFGNGGSGQAFVGLRGLPGNATLFLVDGRRTSTSDLNLIPQAAIESIEVLNDGAGAIYGTDAVAGVVNIKLRKNFRGTMFKTYYGNTFDTDVGTQQYRLLFGTGDEKTSAIFSAEYSKANSLLSPDRERSFPAGSNVSQTSNPGILFNKTDFGVHDVIVGDTTNKVANGTALRWTINPTNSRGLTNSAQVPAFTGAVPATINGFPLRVSGTAFDPLAYVDTSTATTAAEVTKARNDAEKALQALLPANSPVRYANGAASANAVLLPGVNAGFPFGYYTTAYRAHERYGFNTSISHQLFDEQLEVFGDAYYMRNQSEYVFAPPPLGGFTMPSDNYWFRQVFPSSATGTPVNFTYRPVEAGPRIYYDDFQTIHTVAGLRGRIGESTWTWEFSHVYDRTQDDRLLTGGILRDPYQAGLNSTAAGTAFNPFGYTPIGASSAVNAQGVVDAFSGQASGRDVFSIQSIEAQIGGEVFDLPGGAVQVLGGAQRRDESLSISPDSALQTGAVQPFNVEVAWDAKRRIDAVYGEIKVPLLGSDWNLGQLAEAFDLNAAVRYEKFDDIDENTGLKPRVGFRWAALEQQLTIRGSYGQGFIAPSLAAIHRPAGGQDFPEVFNPLTGLRTQPENGVLAVNNPNLKPEEADNYLIGFRYSPKAIKGFTIGLDYYRIEQNGVPFASEQYVVNEWARAGGTSNPNNPFGEGASVSSQNPTAAQVIINPTTQDIDQIVNIGPINTGSRLTDGLDLVLTQEINTGVGKFTLTGNVTHVMTFEMENFPGSGAIDYLGRFWAQGAALADVGFPEWRSVLSLEYEWDRFYAAVAWNFTSGYEEDQSGQNYVTVDPVGSPIDVREVSSYSTVDLRLRYRVPVVEADVTFGINNVLDQAPSAVYSAFESNVDRQFADLRGRFWYVEVAKKF